MVDWEGKGMGGKEDMQGKDRGRGGSRIKGEDWR